MLAASADVICFLIAKARQFHAKAGRALPEDASDMADDPLRALVDDPEDPVEEELIAALRSLNERQLAEVVALTLLGQGEFTPDEWDGALEEARAALEPATPRQLIATPLFASFLEEGYNQLGYSCADWDSEHL